VRPVIAARFPLAQAAAAHAKLEVGGVEGKILLET
jgi:NADPH:quinone reductase-like Zn-dependent oxidoreductase